MKLKSIVVAENDNREIVSVIDLSKVLYIDANEKFILTVGGQRINIQYENVMKDIATKFVEYVQARDMADGLVNNEDKNK